MKRRPKLSLSFHLTRLILFLFHTLNHSMYFSSCRQEKLAGVEDPSRWFNSSRRPARSLKEAGVTEDVLARRRLTSSANYGCGVATGCCLST
jgi:hypothetical protein